MSEFSPIYEDNFSPSFEDFSPEHPESFQLPEYAKGISKKQAATIGLGRGIKEAAGGLVDLGYKALGSLPSFFTNVDEDRKKIAAERKQLKDSREEDTKYWNQGIANQLSPNRYYAKGGELAGEILPSLAIPGATAETLLGRAGLNGLIGGGYEALTSPGDLTERGLKGALGFAGAGLGSAGIETLGKGFSGLAGKWSDPIAQQADKVARSMGLKPRIGDLLPPDEGTIVRAGENFLTSLPYGHGAHNKNTEQLRRLIVPDETTGVNKVTEAVKTTDEAIRKHAASLRKPFDDYIDFNHVLPQVQLGNLKTAVDELLKHDKSFFNKVTDDTIIPYFEGIADGSITKLPIQTVDELRKSLNELYPQVKAMSQVTPGSSKATSNKVSNAFNGALKAVGQDLDQWGQGSFNKKAYKLYEGYRNSWKADVLPWKKSDITYNLKNIEELGAPETAGIVGNEADTQAIDRVRKYLKNYGPKGNSDLVDSLALMRRNAEDLSSVPDRTSHLSSLAGTGADMLGLGLPSTVMRASGTPFGKGWYFGDSSHFMPSDFTGDTSSSILDKLMQGGTRLGIGTGREEADAQLSVLKLISDMKKKHLGNAEDSNISNANQAGTRGNNPIESSF